MYNSLCKEIGGAYLVKLAENLKSEEFYDYADELIKEAGIFRALGSGIKGLTGRFGGAASRLGNIGRSVGDYAGVAKDRLGGVLSNARQSLGSRISNSRLGGVARDMASNAGNALYGSRLGRGVREAGRGMRRTWRNWQREARLRSLARSVRQVPAPRWNTIQDVIRPSY